MSDPAAARIGVALLFVAHGLLVGSWAPHIPLVKQTLDVGPGLFGWLLLAMAAGGVLAMPLAGVAVNRWGSAAVCKVTALAMVATFAAPPLSATPTALATALFAFGAALGALDVAMNAHGIAVEDRLAKPVMSGFHGWYSVGAAAGAGLGGAAIAVFGPSLHLGLAAVAGLAMFAAASTRLLGPVDRGLSGAHFAWPTRATLGLGALCFLALFAEGATLDWAALHLRQSAGASVTQAGLGFAAFSTGMAASRFLGDCLRGRHGAVALVRGGALLMTLGFAAALTASHAAMAIPALAVAGLGIGVIAPVMFAGGGRAEPDAPGRGVAAVTTLGYAGFLIGPPAIGGVAELIGLGPALGLVVVAGLVITLSAGAARAAS